MGESRRVDINQVIGNNALDMRAAYVSSIPRTPQVDGDVQYRTEIRPDANFAKINMLCTIVLAFVIIATLGVCVVFLKTQFNYNDISTRIESVKKELNTIKRENMQLEDDLAGMVDLEMVYEVAVTRLNMRLPGPEDVYYIESNPVTYTTKYGPVQVDNEETSVGSVLGYITRGW